MVKASDCGSDIRGFEPHHPPHLKKTFLKRLFLLLYLTFYRVLKAAVFKGVFCAFLNIL